MELRVIYGNPEPESVIDRAIKALNEAMVSYVVYQEQMSDTDRPKYMIEIEG